MAFCVLRSMGSKKIKLDLTKRQMANKLFKEIIHAGYVKGLRRVIDFMASPEIAELKQRFYKLIKEGS